MLEDLYSRRLSSIVKHLDSVSNLQKGDTQAVIIMRLAAYVGVELVPVWLLVN